MFEISLNAEGDNYYNPSEYDLFEEALIDSAVINGSGFENLLNTNFVYSIAK